MRAFCMVSYGRIASPTPSTLLADGGTVTMEVAAPPPAELTEANLQVDLILPPAISHF